VKNLFTSSFLSKLNAAQFVNGPHIGFKLIRTGVFVQALDIRKANLIFGFCLFCIFVKNTIYELLMEVFAPEVLARNLTKEPVKIGEGNNKAKITYNIHFQAYHLVLLYPPILSTFFLYQRCVRPDKIW